MTFFQRLRRSQEGLKTLRVILAFLGLPLTLSVLWDLLRHAQSPSPGFGVRCLLLGAGVALWHWTKRALADLDNASRFFAQHPASVPEEPGDDAPPSGPELVAAEEGIVAFSVTLKVFVRNEISHDASPNRFPLDKTVLEIVSAAERQAVRTAVETLLDEAVDAAARRWREGDHDLGIDIAAIDVLDAIRS